MSALAFHAEVLRDSEKLCRADGFFEQANAIRMMADAFESGEHCHDLCFFDRGVFDVYGPPDEGEIPYLVSESPRLNPHLSRFPKRPAPEVWS